MLTDSSKGMPTVTVVVGLVATILVGSAILGSLQAIKTTSLDPNVDKTKTQLNQVGDKTVTIASSDRDMARKQMQGAIVWNMLAASDCRILATASLITQGGQSDGFDASAVPFDPEDGKAFKTSPSDFLSELAENQGNGYTGNFDSFLPLEESGYGAPCVGTQSAIKEVEDATQDASNDLVSTAFSAAYKAVGGGLVITGIVSCPFTGGSGCVAAAAGVGMIIESDFAGDVVSEVIVPGGSDDIGSEPGFDMEGVFSRMEFNVEKTFLMGTDDHQEPFFGLALKFPDDSNGNTPGFWRGKRFSYLVPAGMSPDTFDKNKYHRIYDPGSNSKLVKQDFWNGGDNSIDAPGTNQERNEMMFYAFRPRMDVPVLAGETLTDDIITDGCDHEGCSWDVKRLGNFIEHTSYLFCKGASGQIQSNAGHIYSSDEATDQESGIEDQVYPKVEVTSNATGCIPTMTLSVPENVNLDCSPQALVSGASDEIFNRVTVSRGAHTVNVVCGTDGTSHSVDLGGYGYVDYYITEPTISQEGCYEDWYDITSDAHVGGDTIQEGGYPTVLGADGSSMWSHNYNTNYNDGDGENEIGGSGENNRITYQKLAVEYNTSTVENLTYRVSLRGINSGRVTQGMMSDTNTNRTIIIEERPETSETIVREIAENRGAYLTDMRQVVHTDQNFSGSVRELVIDRTSQGGISINGVELASFEGFPEQIAMTKIEISPIRNADRYNREYDWGADSEEEVSDLNATQTDFELRKVKSYSEPRVCKGERGVWELKGKDVIEGE